jgi:hypothetical protein
MPHTESNPAHAPVFIVGTSRSGSTLLRIIVDSHPDFACPPETGVPSACAQLARVWSTVDHAGTGDRWMPADKADLAPRAVAGIRAAVDDIMSDYLGSQGKPRWCDKSLDAYQYVDILSQVYPDAKFILLTRHVMDVVASGVEICPWGLHRFGYDPFVAQYPGNSVAAITAYWIAVMSSCAEFEDERPDKCHRVRYEDLVSAPEETIAGIFDFLGADQVPGIAETCFQTPHEHDGPGDEKLWFTSKVHDQSMGRGVVVPVAAVPAPMQKAANDLLTRFGYRLINAEWNKSTSLADPRADIAADSERPGAPVSDEIPAVIRAIRERIESLPEAEHEEISRHWPTVTNLKILVQGPGGSGDELVWNVPAAAAADGLADEEPSDKLALFIASPATWMSVLAGESNPITAITSGRLRCVNPREPNALGSDENHALGALLGLTSMPVARHRVPGTPALGDEGHGTEVEGDG